ncbi:MAG TPA: response regulator transcription factor [Solirubrobacteraceae bacterium]|jgi:DNA-binding NarL/FixJ family response regulator|nr:response regulator transcription factor [Solirubrobacteraceae bacterium]
MSIDPTPPITLAVAQFEDIVSAGLQSLIDGDPHLQLVAAGVRPDQLESTLTAEHPDVLILNFGSLSRPAELRSLHSAFPDVRLMVLADNPSSAECRQLIGFGATACLAKTTEARDVLHSIYLASRGLHVLPSDAEPGHPTTGPTPLTSREADVLELLQAGSSNAEIAAMLHVSVETVRTHARSIYRKLGVSSRRELRPMS